MRKLMLTTTVTLGLAGAAWAEAPAKKTAEAKVKDPVCGMEIDPKTAAAKSEYKGKTYYFCNKDEKAEFDKSPAAHVKPSAETKKKS
jgi:YHS domain-containing protein